MTFKKLKKYLTFFKICIVGTLKKHKVATSKIFVIFFSLYVQGIKEFLCVTTIL